MSNIILEASDLSFFYGTHRGIKDVNLQVTKGEVFGFLGPNGAGKTTALRLFMDVMRPTSGSAKIFGLDCREQGVQIRQNVGYLPGEFNLYPNMRAKDYLSMLASLRQTSPDNRFRNQLYERLDFDPSRKMRTYSRGNKQKIGLIAAFMNKPELLILDEPTGGLDPIMQHVVAELVNEAKNEGRTVIFSSHILPEVQAVCDRVGIIRQGRLVKTDSVHSLIEQQFKRFRIFFTSEPPIDAFSLNGVSEIARQDKWITLEIASNMVQFMQQAASYGIEEIESLPVTLDEIFMSLYSDEDPSVRAKDSHA
ncbi:MAG: ABC transporter ATP-binding protein [Devosiaceae bacterium]|nr:ABC transporter ATP-binding protein [Devosiaceae bacterium]